MTVKIISNDEGDIYTRGLLFKNIFKRIIIIALVISKQKGYWCDNDKIITIGKSTEKDLKGFHVGMMRLALIVCWDSM